MSFSQSAHRILASKRKPVIKNCNPYFLVNSERILFGVFFQVGLYEGSVYSLFFINMCEKAVQEIYGRTFGQNKHRISNETQCFLELQGRFEAVVLGINLVLKNHISCKTKKKAIRFSTKMLCCFNSFYPVWGKNMGNRKLHREIINSWNSVCMDDRIKLDNKVLQKHSVIIGR